MKKRDVITKQKLARIINDSADSIKDFKTKARVQNMADDLKYRNITMSQEELLELEEQIRACVSRLADSNARVAAAIYPEEKRLHQLNFDNTVRQLTEIVDSIK
jgi:hypothetical protein